jgi:hypothetical protein
MITQAEKDRNDARVTTMMDADQLAAIGSPCDRCGRPLRAMEVFFHGDTCYDCVYAIEHGTAPDRLPSLLSMALVMLPVLSR